MSGASEPQQIRVDPTPEQVKPLQGQVAGLLEQLLGGGMDVPLFERALNLPTFGSEQSGRFAGQPFAAGPEDAQLDALQGFQQAFDPRRLVGTGQIRGAAGGLLGGGGPGLEGGQGFRQFAGGFDLGSRADPFFQQILGQGAPTETDRATAGLGTRFREALEPGRFDLTETFQRGEQAFAGDLDRALAEVREEQSQFGLNPGAEDRSEALLRTAGDLSNRFRLGQLGQAQQAFESAEQRRLGALGLAPSVTAATQAPERLGLQALPSLLQREQQPLQAAQFAQGLGQAGRLGALQQVPELTAIPGQQAQTLFGLGEGLRGIEQQGLERAQEDFARTQGGRLNQVLGLLSGSPLQQTQFGPSKLSQGAQLARAGAQVAGAF